MLENNPKQRRERSCGSNSGGTFLLADCVLKGRTSLFLSLLQVRATSIVPASSTEEEEGLFVEFSTSAPPHWQGSYRVQRLPCCIGLPVYLTGYRPHQRRWSNLLEFPTQGDVILGSFTLNGPFSLLQEES